MRVVMMGTGGFAVPTLRWLLASTHQVLGLVTRPEVAAPGRRAALPPNPMRQVADEHQLTVWTPANVNAATAQGLLTGLAADLFVVCDYGQILAGDTLALARLGGINLHGSLLPQYRGAAPVQWTLYDGLGHTGVSVIHMTPRLDAGPILAVRHVTIDPQETAEELEVRLAVLGVEAVDEALRRLSAWDGQSAIGVPQDSSQATPARRLKKLDGLVDWTRRAQEVVNQIRAFQPWPGTYTFWQRSGGPSVRLVLDRATLVSRPPGPGEPGQVVASDGQQMLVATSDGAVRLDRIQPAGKKVLSASEFLRGYPIRVGDRLGSA